MTSFLILQNSNIINGEENFDMKKFTAIFTLLMTVSSMAQIMDKYYQESQLVFDDSSVGMVEILIKQEYLDYIMNNVYSDSLFPVDFIFTNHIIQGDTVRNVGFRLRGTTSRTANKKSFKIDFNEFIKGQKFYQLEKMNLKAVFTDPSVTRAKIYSDIACAFDQPCFRANHVKVYINGEYRGLYINVEHIDENFVKSRLGNNDGNLYKCVYGADLDYHGSDQSFYKNLTNHYGAFVYELKTNKDLDDFSDLVHFINVINNTPDDSMKEKIEDVFNLPAFLKSMAVDVMTGNWDNYWYLNNNFYLYHNTATDRFEWILCDADETFGLWWDSNGGPHNFGTRNIYDWGKSWKPRPAIENTIEKFDSYCNIYSHFLKDLTQQVSNSQLLVPHINSIHALITPALETDPYYGKDYKYTIQDFHDSYETQLSSFSHVQYGFKPFIATRYNEIGNQLSFYDIPPIIFETSHSPVKPSSQEFVIVTAFITDEDSLTHASVRYNSGAGYQQVDMFDDGAHGDGKAGDHVFGATIPPQQAGATINYYIWAQDIDTNEKTDPENAPSTVYIYQVATATPKIYINEFLASNDSLTFDEYNEDDDWIELYNAEDTTVNLKGKYLTDNLSNPIKWQLPDTTMEAGGFLLIWADKQTEQGKLHANFKLNKEGEQIGLFDTDTNGNIPIDTLTFSIQTANISYGRISDGDSLWKFFTVPTPGISNITPEVPVQLAFFHPSISGNTIILNWKTYQEKNNYCFTIERSQNRVDFKTVGAVKGHGTTTVEHFYQFKDDSLAPGCYYYRLKQIDFNGNFTYSEIITAEISLLKDFELYQNYPNPFNSQTTIEYKLRDKSQVTLQIINLLGQTIRVLVNSEKLPGLHSIHWDGKGDFGETVSAGVYFYRIQAGKFVEIKKLIIMK